MADNLTQIVESFAERLATGFLFTEGPVWHPDGYLLFVDVRQENIHKLVPGGDEEVFRRNSGGCSGLTLDLQGRLVMCEGFHRLVTRMEADGTVVTIAERWNGKRLNRPNDAVCRSDGSIYFTNPGERLGPYVREIDSSPVHRIASDGTITAVITDMEFPNGLAFSPDESLLYVANTRRHPHIRAYDVAPDGSMETGYIFAEMASARTDGVPDGVKVDVEGRVYCAGPGGCWVFAPSGEHLGTIELPEYPSNCAWGGPDNRTMFFTANTSVYSLRMKTPGTPLPTAG